MEKPKTHFEQVPLEIIKNIVAEQLPPEEIIKPDEAIRNKKAKKSLMPANGQSKASSRTGSRMESTRQ